MPPTKASPTASRRGHFLSLNSYHFNFSVGVVDMSDGMWYTNVSRTRRVIYCHVIGSMFFKKTGINKGLGGYNNA